MDAPAVQVQQGAQAPRVYMRLVQMPLLGFASRAVAMIIAIACLGTLITAAMLTPNPDGTGTHTGLGMAKCGLILRAGIPCATCGMTTSFAHFVRGNWLGSFYVQPMGFFLALATGIGFWAGMYIAISGKPAHRLILLIPTRYYVLPLMFFALAAWAWKIFIFVHGMDGWR